jgi:hypothetical protein
VRRSAGRSLSGDEQLDDAICAALDADDAFRSDRIDVAELKGIDPKVLGRTLDAHERVDPPLPH